MSFYNDGFIIKLEQDLNEPQDKYIERGYFVVCQKPKSVEEYLKAKKYSRIYINNKYLGCEFTEKVMEELNKMKENLFVNT